MLSRITLLVITVFWLCMNFLLWRSEFGGNSHVGAKVPVNVVWQKILTSPDSSGLQITHHGKDMGRGEWRPNFGQELTSPGILTDGVLAGASAQKLTGFRINFDGNFSVVDSVTRARFTIDLVFTTNYAWQEFSASLRLNPDGWYIQSKASEQTLHLRVESEDEKSDHTYKFSDLQNPRFLVQEFQLPISLQMLDAFGLTAAGQSGPALSPGLIWEARNDWISIGHTSVRAYRLQARLFDRFRVIIMVSEVGEILRVELPDEWTLINTQFSDF